MVSETNDLNATLLYELTALLELLRLPDEALQLVIQQSQQFAYA